MLSLFNQANSVASHPLNSGMVTFIVGSPSTGLARIHAHKHIVEPLLLGGQHNVIRAVNCNDGAAFRSMVKFLYTGEISHGDLAIHALELLRLAKTHAIESLHCKCEAFLCGVVVQVVVERFAV